MQPSCLTPFAAGALALALSTVVHATTVAVDVNGADGQPAPNIVVQLLPAHPVAHALPAAPVVIAQKDVRFVPYLTAVPAGTTVRFSNEDPFDHHLRSEPGGPLGTVPPARAFEMRLAAASGGKVASIELRFDQPGAIVLGCHLHSSMHGHLFVSETPFVGVTDLNGHVVINDVPEGSAELLTWSPDQLTSQVASTHRISGGATSLDTRLNFTPSKPRRRHG